MAIYVYLNPKTGETFEEIVSMSKSNDDFILEDGTICKRIIDIGNMGIEDINRESFKKDLRYVRKIKPKYLKFKDGHREKYDYWKHS